MHRFFFFHCTASEVLNTSFLLQEASGNSVLLQDVLSDAELDAQLDSLREKLAVVTTL